MRDASTKLTASMNKARTSSCITLDVPMEPIAEELLDQMPKAPTLWECLKAWILPKRARLVEEPTVCYIVPKARRRAMYRRYDEMVTAEGGVRTPAYRFWEFVTEQLKGVPYDKLTTRFGDVTMPFVLLHGVVASTIDQQALRDNGLYLRAAEVNGEATMVIIESEDTCQS